MTPSEPSWQGLRTFGRFLGIAAVALALLIPAMAMCDPDRNTAMEAAGILPLTLRSLAAAVGYALILLGVLRVMRVAATTAVTGLEPNLVPPVIVILAGAIMIHGEWGAPLALAVVVATSLLGRPRRSAADVPADPIVGR